MRVLAAAWLGAALITTLPYLAAQQAPRSVRFTGAIFYVDDFYQYLSFAEQASRGALVFSNKFDPRPAAPVLVNLEWGLAGALGRFLGGSIVGFHVLRLAALAALLAGAQRLLRTAGVIRVGWALLVVAGGGLGWLRFWQGVPVSGIPDILMGLFPFHQAVFNAHALVGTALLLWTLLLRLDWIAGGKRWPFVLCGWVLGLCRPYDLATALVVAGVLALWQGVTSRSWRAPLRQTAELSWFAPLLAYYAMIVTAHPSFSGWGAQTGDVSPSLPEFAFALGPGIALVLASWRRSLSGGSAPIRHTLTAWCLVLGGLLLVWHAPMAKQYTTSLGLALLLWGAVVTPPRALPFAAAALAPTSLLLAWVAFHPAPQAFAPAEYFDAVDSLRTRCAPGDVVLAPNDLSLLVAGLTPCSVALGHRLLTPDFAAEMEEAGRFYAPATATEWRIAYLRRKRFAFVVLPAGRGDWLGRDAPLRSLFAGGRLELFRVGEL